MADALGELVGALEVGLRQRHGHLLTAVPGRLVDLARRLAQHAGDLLQDEIALEMPVRVVDVLEVVDVEHDQAHLLAVAAGALDLDGHDLLEAAVVEQARELVGHRLPLHGFVQVDVLDGHRRLVRQVREQLTLGGRERVVPAGHRDDADHLVAALRRPQRSGQRARAADLDLGDLAGIDHRRLGGVQRAPERLGLAAARDLLQPVVGPAHRRAAGRGVDALDRRLHDDLQHAHAVQPRGDRLADAADRLLQPLALELQLVEALRQLRGHLVELLPERGELVVALRRHLHREVARAEPLGGHEQPLDLRLQAARDRDREHERERQERDERGQCGEGGARRGGRRVEVGHQQRDVDLPVHAVGRE